MKVIIPTAGYGKRLRPHTYTRPKPLINVAGEPMLKHVIDSVESIDVDEFIFVVGYLGDQIEHYVRTSFSFNSTFLVQDEMIGQAHAIYLAKEHLQGPAIILFADTLFEADLNILKHTDADGVIYVKEVEDPTRFGVVSLDDDGYITKFVEKPKSKKNRLAVIGLYYMRDSQWLIRAIEKQMSQKIIKNGEYFIADAFQIMIDEGAKFITQQIGVWLDCGTPKTVLETNRYLLENGFDNSGQVKQPHVTVIPPVYIHPEATFEHAIIGPHATVSAGCHISYSIIRDSIIDEGAVVRNTTLDDSLIGRDARVAGRYHTLNVGDSSSLDFEE